MQTSFHFLRLSTRFPAQFGLLTTPFVQSTTAAVIHLLSFGANQMAEYDAFSAGLHPMLWEIYDD